MLAHFAINFRITKLACVGLGITIVLLSGCKTFVNSVQGLPTREIYPGQTVVGSLSIKRHVDVDTKLQISTAPLGFVYKSNGQTWKADLVSTPTGRPDTFYGTSQFWKINTEYISQSAEFALVVQGVEFMPAVMLYVDTTESEASSKDKPGFVLPVYSELSNTVAGAFRLEPKKSYFLIVQVNKNSDNSPANPNYKMMLRKN